MKEKLKIAHVTRRFTKKSWGGIEEALINLCLHMKEKHIFSKIYTTKLMDLKPVDSVEGIHIKRFKSIFPWWGLSSVQLRQMEKLGGNCFSWSLLKALYKDEVDIIHTHIQHRMGSIARWVAKKKNIPYIVSVHGDFLTIPDNQRKELESPFKSKWEWGKVIGWWFGSRRVLQDASAIICVNPNEAQKLIEIYPNKKILFIPNGVRQNSFASAKENLFREFLGIKDKEYLLFTGRIDPQKNQMLLLEAFTSIKERYPQMHLVLIGAITNTIYYNRLKTYIDEQGIAERVHIVSSIEPRSDLLYSAYKGAKIFILPSQAEPFGIVLLEAWAANIPVIASNTGGVPSIIENEKNGLLFANGNKDCLVKNLIRLTEDADLKAYLKSNATKSLKNYSWDDIANRYIDVYKEVLHD